jgi:hypothetical protein
MVVNIPSLTGLASADPPPWTSPNRYHLSLSVDPKGVARSNSPASVDIDFVQALADLGESGTFDEHTIEIIAYNASNEMVIFDTSRTGYEQYLLPWRIQKYYGIDTVSLSFVMPDHTCTHYEVYFDTVESGYGQPQRYPGLVGNGDLFTEEYKRREIGAAKMDTFCDFDNDGDLDLLKVTNEPFIYYYENVGNYHYIYRGRLTSNGNLFELPKDGGNRCWPSVEAYDWDEDGDQDLFVGFTTGPYADQRAIYENITAPGGQPTFIDRGLMYTQTGNPIGDGWFATITIVDWDGDGKKDLLATHRGNWEYHRVEFHKNVGTSTSLTDIQLADGIPIQVGGQDLILHSPRLDCADIDSDGDLDLFATQQNGDIFWYQNIGTRQEPVFENYTLIATIWLGHAGIKIADFDGEDGLLDIMMGGVWTAPQSDDGPRIHAQLYKNIGTPTEPGFETRDAYNGAPYTEQFQIADAGRQNEIRAVDWNNDGKTDLISGSGDLVWYFRNLTYNRYPIFATGEKLRVGGQGGDPVRVMYPGASYARTDVCDWNNDGLTDLLVADDQGWLGLFLNEGTPTDPILAPGQRIYADGSPIDRGTRAHVMVCDWNQDGKKDVVFSDQENPGYYWFQNIGSDANPVLDSAMPIYFGGQQVTYIRPNLGSYLDWDGDGKKDFISCQYEVTIHFYKNIGSGQPGALPQFANPDGQILVQPYTTQMISTVHALDWRGDGDIDILTGQGHGGSGLRLYERDYINDFLNNTYPIVTIDPPEKYGDLDNDTDIDQEDFGLFQMCLSGDGSLHKQGCDIADLDSDGDVDRYDFAIFQSCMTGPNNPIDPNCAQ